MTFLNDRKEITITAMDGGWMVEWTDDTLRPKEHPHMAVFPRPEEVELTGRYIVTSEKELIKRLKEFLRL